MNRSCPKCIPGSNSSFSVRKVVKIGSFFRTSDRARLQRYLCRVCQKTFSDATNDLCFKQLKRHKNKEVGLNLVSTGSQRRTALNLKLNRKTVARKLIFLGSWAKVYLREINISCPKATAIEFDDLETIEQTKLKPLSVTMAVEHRTRRILGFTVSKMPAKGLIAKKSRKKFGHRKDERPLGRRILFESIKSFVSNSVEIRSDQSPHYPADVKEHFPYSRHICFMGLRARHSGQGELKKGGFDSLFSINHTFAKLRADINRLIRRTWCTTKKPERLELHIALYAVYHNMKILNAKT